MGGMDGLHDVVLSGRQGSTGPVGPVVAAIGRAGDAVVAQLTDLEMGAMCEYVEAHGIPSAATFTMTPDQAARFGDAIEGFCKGYRKDHAGAEVTEAAVPWLLIAGAAIGLIALIALGAWWSVKHGLIRGIDADGAGLDGF